MTRKLAELHPRDLAEQIEKVPAIVQPIGTLEWHSHHLPLGLDGLVAESVCEAVTGRSGAILAPTTYLAAGGVPFPYTFELTGSDVEPLYERMIEAYSRMGFRVLLAFTGHFGLEQTLALKRAALTVMSRMPLTVLPLTTYDLTIDTYTGDHAAVGETSLMLAIRPDLVDLSSIPREKPLEGVLGEDPRGRASEAFGNELKDLIVERAADLIAEHLQNGPLFQRHYVEALRAGVRVLERTWHERMRKPKSAVPSITSPAYLEHCSALWSGDFSRAKERAEDKLLDLSE